ncbi:MAG TPA: hypothetical protein PKH65_01560 [Bacteroidia bacterium]|nr:hypothetical protein [Bacteroidia bacterium]HNT79342.1 hypothetical protein [Bacteroidia bacterium]
MKKEEIEKAYQNFKQRMDILMQAIDKDLAKAELDLLIHYTNQFIKSLGLDELNYPVENIADKKENKTVEVKPQLTSPTVTIADADIEDEPIPIAEAEIETKQKIKIKPADAKPSKAEVLAQNNSSSTLHDRMTKTKPDPSLADKLEKKPLNDMKKGIGINEKFIFISELFKGDQNSYSTGIEKLNSCQSMSEAERVLQNLSGEFEWQSESTAYTLLHNLVERRYAN